MEGNIRSSDLPMIPEIGPIDTLDMNALKAKHKAEFAARAVKPKKASKHARPVAMPKKWVAMWKRYGS